MESLYLDTVLNGSAYDTDGVVGCSCECPAARPPGLNAKLQRGVWRVGRHIYVLLVCQASSCPRRLEDYDVDKEHPDQLGGRATGIVPVRRPFRAHPTTACWTRHLTRLHGERRELVSRTPNWYRPRSILVATTHGRSLIY